MDFEPKDDGWVWWMERGEGSPFYTFMFLVSVGLTAGVNDESGSTNNASTSKSESRPVSN